MDIMASRSVEAYGGLLNAPTEAPFCRSTARLSKRATVVEPLSARVTSREESLSSTCTEISKMKGQSLQSSINAKLIGVNLRFITYAMKEGQVRVINQNGKDMLRIGNTQEAHILDLTLNGTGERQGPPSIVVTLDSTGRVAINQLEAKLIQGEKRTKCSELVFPLEDQPRRVLGHPTDSKLFTTMHDNHFIVWSISLLEEETPAGEAKRKLHQATAADTSDIYMVDEELVGAAGLKVCIESGVDNQVPSSTATLLDASFTSEGDCFVALTRDALIVWKATVNTSVIGNSVRPRHALAGLERLQTISLANIPETGNLMPEELSSLRMLRASPKHLSDGSDLAEVLVLAAASSCLCAAFEFFPKTRQPVGRLVQTVRLAQQAEAVKAQNISVDSVGHDYLILALHGHACICILPVALNWFGASSGLPFPCLHRVFTDELTHQLSVITSKSYNVDGQGLFLYRAHNFTREKDKLAGCHVMVNEILEEHVSRQQACPCPELLEIQEQATETVPAHSLMGADVMESRSRSPTPPLVPSDSPAADVATAVAADTKSASGWLEESTALAVEINADKLQEEDPDIAERDDIGDFCSSVPPEDTMVEEEADVESKMVVESSFAHFPPRFPPSELQAQAPVETSLTGAPRIEAKAGREAEEEEEDERRRTEDNLQESRDGTRNQQIDRGFVKQIAASFVRGMEKRRTPLADKIVKEIAENVQAYQMSAAVADTGDNPSAKDASALSSPWTQPGAGKQQALEEALQKLHEVREGHDSNDKNFALAVRKATDACAEASAASVALVLQKELARASDGVAVQLAQQLSHSRKFCEALTNGLQKTSGGATRQALESLRMSKQMQDSFGTAVAEALHESLEPVFRKELRMHFEQDLAPLIARRVGEMMSSFKEKVGDCLGIIAQEHEQIARRLGEELAPVLTGELKKLERTVASTGPNAHGNKRGLSEADLDDITKSVEDEVVQPLQAQIHALKKQVRMLQEQSQEMERRWGVATASLVAAVDAAAGSPDIMPPTPCLSGLRQSPAELEEQQAVQLERQFHDNRAEDAFTKAIQRQSKAAHVDFLGRLCALVRDPSEWLDSTGDRPLSEKFKCILMLALANQLATSPLKFASGREEWTADKVRWINELWLSLDLQDSSVRNGAQDLCKQLADALGKAPLDVGDAAGCLKNLKRQVQKFSQLLKK